MDSESSALAAPEGPSTETRDRLLTAGGDVFAEHGFRRATVRDICARAGANVAAINYHFGDKEGLYQTVLRHGLKRALEKFPPEMGVAPDAPAEQRLHAFIRAFLYRVLDDGAQAWYGKLMAHEMMEPTGALETVVQETVRPLQQRLAGIIRELLPPHAAADADADVVMRCTFSIVSQCLFYHFAGPVIDKLRPGLRHGPDRIEALADHVTAFSLAALRSLGARGAGKESRS